MRSRRAALLVLPALALGIATCSRLPNPQDLPRLAGNSPRFLFFALDSIPYRVVAELTDPERGDEALFRGFSRPIPLISSFPSTSSVAFTGILEPFDLPRPPGYEAKFFDRRRNAVRGGGPISYRKISFAWREFFTWRYGEPIRRGLATARPARSSIAEVLWVLEAFAESEERTFHGYVAMTDGAAHLKGPQGLVAALETLDSGLEELRRRNPNQTFYSIIYSDHGIYGGEPLTNVRQGVRHALTDAGFHLRKKLRDDEDAVMVPFGLVSSFEVYAEPGRGPALAGILSRVEGVDLCVARGPEPDRWQIESARGQAVIGRRPGPGDTLWAYLPGSGDPLAYQPLVEELRRRAGDTEREWFPDAWWFAASWDHHYPDALHRIARTFDLVENSASTVCSLAPGHMYGAWATDIAARLSTGRLEWTHGALFDQASRGFLITDLPGWQPPAAVRFDEALAPFAPSPEPFLGGARTAASQ